MKYAFRQERLSFKDKYLSCEQDLIDIPFNQDELDELMAQGKMAEIFKIINEHVQALSAAAPTSLPLDDDIVA